MAKGKTTKAAARKPSTGPANEGPSARPAKADKVQKLVTAAKVEKVMKGAKKIAANPATSEIIAATLVAAAAALRDPKKARALAEDAADDLRTAAKEGVEGGALWQLALDVARRSMDTIGGKGPKAGPKMKDKAKDKAKGKAKPKAKEKARKAGKKK